MLQVISRKDQAQYWCRTEPYSYVSVDQFVIKFKECQLGQKLNQVLSKPFDKSESHKSSLSFNKYSLPKWELLKACTRREFLLMKRNSFIYVFKTTQVASLITAKLLCLKLIDNQFIHGPFLSKIVSWLSFSLSLQLVIIAAITMTVLLRTRLAVDMLHANDYMGAIFYSLLHN